MTDIRAVFEAGGPAAQYIEGYRPRASQIEMASAVFEAIDNGENLIVEAGTGTGKTWAYLLPVITSNMRAIISTGTLTLQDQLFRLDLPRVLEMTGENRRCALLKGRRNYLCPRRLEMNMKHPGRAVRREDLALMVQVRQWHNSGASGDLTGFMDLDSHDRVLPLITSTADNCLGRRCEHFESCPLYRARSRAAEADIVIVNHHLLFSDMAMSDENVTPLLPAAHVVVLDEAHQSPAVARQFFGHRLTSHQLRDLARDILIEVAALGHEDVGVASSAKHLEALVDRLAAAWAASRPRAAIAALLEEIDLTFVSLLDQLARVEERSRGYQHCHARALRLADLFSLLTEGTADGDDYAQWIDASGGDFALHLSPLCVAEEFGSRIRESRQRWIFTSATLAVKGDLAHFAAEIGLPEAKTKAYSSPFDYGTQVAGIVPDIEAPPGSETHTRELIAACIPLLRACPGRTFLLFTSWRALSMAAEILADMDEFHCLKQGSRSRSALLDSFGRIDRCVLLATQSFWEGVDVRGASLKLLVIDKLPFPSPDHALVRARIDHAQRQGQNGFEAILLPQAIISLRQGFGRLVREESDKGLFLLGDPRIRSRSYGAAIARSLPPINWLTSTEEAVRWLQTA